MGIIFRLVILLPVLVALPLSGQDQPAGQARGETPSLSNPEAALQGRDVRAIFQDGGGDFWFGTRHNGLMRWNEDGTTTCSAENGLLSNGILSIAEDDKGTIWCAGGGGVQAFNGQTWTTYPLNDEIGLEGRVVFSVRSGPAGMIWIGSSGGGASFDERFWQTYTAEESLSHNVVHDLFQDQEHYGLPRARVG